MDTLTNHSDAVVLAEKVQQTSALRQIYLKHLKAAPAVKKKFYEELRKQEGELETIAYGILHPLPSAQVYQNKRY